MQSIVYNDIEGTIVITQTFENDTVTKTNAEFNQLEFNTQNFLCYFTGNSYSGPTFSNIGDEYSATYSNLGGVKCFKNFSYDATGIIETRYLDTYYRISRDGINWTTWLQLQTGSIENFPPFDARYYMYIAIKWVRSGTNTSGQIVLNDYVLQGSILRNITDGLSPIQINSENKTVIVKPPFTYKVFSITATEILSRGDISNITIKYRFSQDNGRTVSLWEPFTTANISTVRINPIRFFQIEYLLEYSGNSDLSIIDINLIGSFQNVTLDYFKTNLYGIRESCSSDILGYSNGQPIVGLTYSTAYGVQNYSSGSLISNNANTSLTWSPLTQEQKNKLFKPYQQNQTLQFLNKISNDTTDVFGFPVVYFLTDPDKNGIDYTFHEYQLYNYVCEGTLQISVADQNKFPDNQVIMNAYDMGMFESFEIHITKESFKLLFGVDKRPSTEDFLWFCEINRMFQVEHAQQYKNFNNAAIYYKVILKKWVQKGNVMGSTQQIIDKVKDLSKNSTIQELMGLENLNDMKSNSNKLQYEPLSIDRIRLVYNVSINKELIENSTNIISKSNYDLSTVPYQTSAITYNYFKNWFKPSDNIGFTVWFSINNYNMNEVYNFFDYYNPSIQQGITINLESDNITVNVNSLGYTFSLAGGGSSTTALNENVWYAYVLNIDQRKNCISQYLYKRNVDNEYDAAEIGSSILQQLYTNTQTYTNAEFQVDGINAQILASDMKLTNLRLFSDIIPENYQSNLLNQTVIGVDAKYLILADNANSTIIIPNIPYGQTPAGDLPSVNQGTNISLDQNPNIPG